MGLKHILKTVFCSWIGPCREDPTDSKPRSQLIPKGAKDASDVPATGSSQTLHARRSSDCIEIHASKDECQEVPNKEKRNGRKRWRVMQWFRAKGVRKAPKNESSHQSKAGKKGMISKEKEMTKWGDETIPGRSTNNICRKQPMACVLKPLKSSSTEKHEYSSERQNNLPRVNGVAATSRADNFQTKTPQSSRSAAYTPSCTQSLNPRALRKYLINDPCCSYAPSPISIRSHVAGLTPLRSLTEGWWKSTIITSAQQDGAQSAGVQAVVPSGKILEVQVTESDLPAPDDSQEVSAPVETVSVTEDETPEPAPASELETIAQETEAEPESLPETLLAAESQAPPEAQEVPPTNAFTFGRRPNENTAGFDARIASERFHDAEQFFLKNWSINPLFDDIFALGDIIGEGAFGFVMEAHAVDMEKCLRCKFPPNLALKFINKGMIRPNRWVYDSEGQRVTAEILMLASLDHPGIIRFVCVFDHEKYQIMVTELHGARWELQAGRNRPGAVVPLVRGVNPRETVEGGTVVRRFLEKRRSGDLFECIDATSHLTEATARHVMLQLLNAFYYLHFQRGVVHRDLKDENIVVDDRMVVKIIDFGSAAPIPQRKEGYFRTFVGTVNFAAPENMLNEPYQGPPQDIWALGIILFTMLAGDNPFHGGPAIINGDLDTPWPSLSEAGHDFLNWMLTREPEARPNAAQLLGHWWFVESLPGEETV